MPSGGEGLLRSAPARYARQTAVSIHDVPSPAASAPDTAPTDQEQLTRRLLQLPGIQARRFSLARVVTEPQRVIAHFTGAAGQPITLSFTPAGSATHLPHVRTQRFMISVLDGGPLARELLVALLPGVRRLERQWAWPPVRDPATPRPTAIILDVEAVALKAGLRSGMRLTVSSDELAQARARYAASGLQTDVVRHPGRLAFSTDLFILYVGKTVEAVSALRRAEDSGDDAELGRRLGYPECCIQRFLERRARHVSWRVSEFEAVRDAWDARPLPRLNTLLFARRTRYLSFEPCSFRCSRASAVADTLAGELLRASPTTVAFLDEALECAVAIRPDGTRATLSLGLQRDRIVAAHPVEAVADGAVTEVETDFAARLAGCSIEPQGNVTVDGEAAVVVVDFASSLRT